MIELGKIVIGNRSLAAAVVSIGHSKMDESKDLGDAAGQLAGAQTTKGKMMAKSADELKKARESRAADALKMKDEQLRILSEQNASLLQSLDKQKQLKTGTSRTIALLQSLLYRWLLGLDRECQKPLARFLMFACRCGSGKWPGWYRISRD